MAQLLKNPPANREEETPVRSLGRDGSPGGGHASLLQDSCPEDPMGRGVRWATDHSFARVALG